MTSNKERYQYLVFLILGIAALACSSVASGRTVDVNEVGASAHSLTEYLAILEDPTRKLTLADVQRSEVAAQFKSGNPPAEELALGFTRSAYWVRIDLRNSSDLAIERMFELAFPRISDVQIFVLDQAGAYRSIETGMAKPFGTRLYLNRNFVVPLTLPAHSQLTAYLRLESLYRLFVPARLWTPEAFREYERNDYVGQAMYFGLALGMVIYNLLLFASIRDSIYLKYITFVICTAAAVASKNGIAKEFLWTDSPTWSDLSTFTLYSLSLATGILFLRHMLNLSSLLPRIDRLLGTATTLYLLTPLGFLASFQIVAASAAIFNFGMTFFLVAIIVYCAYRRQRNAYFALVAFAMLLLGSFLTVLKANGLLPTNILTLNGLQIGSALEMLLLAIALADRFNQERMARVAAQNALVEGLKRSESALEERVIQRTQELSHEQERTRELLHNILPAELAEELSTTGHASSARHEAVTILFTDFSGFTQVASTMPADRMVAELNEIFAGFDDICDQEGVEKIKTIGDAYMAAAGLPKPCPDHAQRCVTTGLRMIEFIERRNQKAAFKWQLRVGIHSGPVVAGVVGKRKYAFDIWGDTVNIASRMESSGEVGRVNISAYTYDLVGNDFDCEYRGKVVAKGKGEIDMYFVKGTRTEGPL